MFLNGSNQTTKTKTMNSDITNKIDKIVRAYLIAMFTGTAMIACFKFQNQIIQTIQMIINHM